MTSTPTCFPVRDRVRRSIAALFLCALSLAAVACVESEAHQTLYLDADGALTWTVLERDVRSTADDRARRAEEEAGYLASVRNGTHAAAVALDRLGGTPTTRLLRDQVPFTVATEAWFPRLDVLLTDFFAALGIRARGTSSCDAGRCVLELTVEATEEETEVTFDEILALLGSAEGESLRLVRTDGRFLAAEGFTLEDKGRIAVLDLERDVLQGAAPISLRLTWR